MYKTAGDGPFALGAVVGLGSVILQGVAYNAIPSIGGVPTYAIPLATNAASGVYEAGRYVYHVAQRTKDRLISKAHAAKRKRLAESNGTVQSGSN